MHTPPAVEVTHQRRTALALAVAMRDLHSYALESMAVPVFASGPPGGYSSCARRMMLLQKRVKVMSVLADRASGATWVQIAAAWGLDPEDAHRLYAPMEERWRAGDAAPWSPDVPGLAPVMPIHVGEDTEQHLRTYFWGHHSPGALPGGTGAVN